MDTGYLELIIGPMFAGKSTELIRQYRLFTLINKRVLAINNSLNNRYGNNKITTHNIDTLDNCIILENLSDLNNDLIQNNDVFLIEELQFFKNAYNFIKFLVEDKNKIVIAAGLDGDSNREPFGDVLKLIPIADKVKRIKAICKLCNDGTNAIFTKCISNKNSKILVGENNHYISVCRKHYLQ